MGSDIDRTNGDRDGAPSPMQEVEYALILSRIIGKVEADPAQMRSMIYEFARAKLKIDLSEASDSDRKRLTGALETAIQGVEDFSQRNEHEGLSQIEVGSPPNIKRLTTSRGNPKFTSVMDHDVWQSETQAHQSFGFGAPRRSLFRKNWWRSAPAIGGLAAAPLVIGLACLLAYTYFPRQFQAKGPSAPTPSFEGAAKNVAGQVPQIAQQGTSAAPAAASPGFPLPAVYGIYALDKGALTELNPLQEVVPDRRVAISTPIGKPAREVGVGGDVKFVIYRRDANNLPDRIDIRVVAQVTRALTFDAKGKGSFSPVADVWNIRSNVHEFRVRPVPANPDMLLVQPGSESATLPAGRYVLVLKNQGYDFTVTGPVTDPEHCLERTEAANGTFYSACPKS